MKHKYAQKIIAVLTVVFASAFQGVFLYCRNAEEAKFMEAALVLIAFSAIGLILMLLFWLITRSGAKAAVSASLMALILTNFALLEKPLKVLIPSLNYWHTLSIIVFVGLNIVFLFCHFTKEDFARAVSGILCLVFGALILINIVTAAPQLLSHLWANKEATDKTDGEVAADEDSPNVYFLMFDEYANFPQIEQYYGYDNAVLKDFLEENNFAIDYTGHNDSLFSSTTQANIVNLDYIVDNYDSEAVRGGYRANSLLSSIMREHGYDVQMWGEDGHQLYGGYNPVRAENRFTSMLSMEGLLEICAEKTVIYPFWSSWTANRQKHIDGVIDLANYVSDPDNIPERPTFTLVYFYFPHHPFVVDEDGNAVPESEGRNWKDDQYYLGQFKFATKLMIQMLDNLVHNDPSCVIMLQSDHGARAMQDSDLFLTKFPLEVMNNPLNAVYYSGDKILDIEGLSGVNTVRTVVNELFDMDYEMLDVPADTYEYIASW